MESALAVQLEVSEERIEDLAKKYSPLFEQPLVEEQRPL